MVVWAGGCPHVVGVGVWTTFQVHYISGFKCSRPCSGLFVFCFCFGFIILSVPSVDSSLVPGFLLRFCDL